MSVNFRLWRFVITLGFAKSLLWGKGDETYWLFIGTFTDGKNTAFKFVFLPFTFCAGFIKGGDL